MSNTYMEHTGNDKNKAILVLNPKDRVLFYNRNISNDVKQKLISKGTKLLNAKTNANSQQRF